MINIFKGAKILEGSVTSYEPNTVYFVLKDDGTFDILATDTAGNPKALAQQELDQHDLGTIVSTVDDDAGLLISPATLKAYLDQGKGILGSTSKSALHILTPKDVGMAVHTTQHVAIPAGRIGVHAVITIVNTGTEDVTLSTYPGVTLRLAGTTDVGWATIKPNSMATIRQVDYGLWYVQGAEYAPVGWGDGSLGPIAKRPNTDGTGWTYYATPLAVPGRVYVFEGQEWYVYDGYVSLQELIDRVDRTGNVTVGGTTLPVNNLITTHVQNMAGLFYEKATFNFPLDHWDTSSVYNMQEMFAYASGFNQPIGGWDTSSVYNMREMFAYASGFNQPIGGWDTSSVYEIYNMFENASKFNQDLRGWDTSNIESMRSLFQGAESFNGDISNWDTGKVKDLYGMFQHASAFNQNLNTWNVSGVKNTANMFYGSAAFNGDISNWDVSSVREMYNMFSGASAFNQDLSMWDVSSCTSFGGMFSGALSFNSDIGGWNTSKATDMRSMFSGASVFNRDISKWDVSNVKDFGHMFSQSYGGPGMAFNQPIGKWNMKSATSFRGMFGDNYSFNQPLGDWNVSSAYNMEYMFLRATAFNQDLSRWCVTKIPHEPRAFAEQTPNWVKAGRMPHWGTCPTPGSSGGTESSPGCKPKKNFDGLGWYRVPGSSVKPGITHRKVAMGKKINIC